jgi:hypothetical protein
MGSPFFGTMLFLIAKLAKISKINEVGLELNFLGLGVPEPYA